VDGNKHFNCRAEFGIVCGMISARSLLMRSLAAFMPIYLIGLFVACVTLCLAHSDEPRQARSIYSSLALEPSAEEEGCPITGVPESILPHRPSPIQPVSVSQPVALVFIEPAITGLNRAARAARLLTSSDPPFERLCTLRV
jgi:hypothetical protein